MKLICSACFENFESSSRNDFMCSRCDKTSKEAWKKLSDMPLDGIVKLKEQVKNG